MIFKLIVMSYYDGFLNVLRLKGLLLGTLFPSVAGAQLVNIATITPPTSVYNSNPDVSCTSGVCAARASNTVASVADLTLTKVISVSGSGSATSGATLSYTVTLVNLGPSVAQNVTLSDILSAGLSLINSSGNNGTATVSGATPDRVTTDLVAALFELDAVYVGRMKYNTNREGAASARGYVWGKSCALIRVTDDPSPRETGVFAKQFQFGQRQTQVDRKSVV